jgi:hypothetical protein
MYMKSIRQVVITSAAIALSVSVAMAQDGGASGGPGRWRQGRDGRPDVGVPGRQMRPGGMRHGGMHHRRMHDPIARLLQHQTLLHLTPAQVNSIISIDDKLHSDNKPLVQQLRGMRVGGRGRPDSHSGGDDADQASAAHRDSVVTIMRTVRENVWRATAAADALLTPEQLNTAGSLDRAGHMGMMFRPPGLGPEGPGGRGNGGPRGE